MKILSKTFHWFIRATHSTIYLLAILGLAINLCGCGAVLITNNSKVIDTTEIGTPKDQVIGKMMSGSYSGECHHIGIIGADKIESCDFLVNYLDPFSNNVLFFKDRYIGTGNTREIMEKLFNNSIESTTDKNNGIILLTRIGKEGLGPMLGIVPKLPKIGKITIYVNGQQIGELLGDDTAFMWGQESGPVKLTLMQQEKLINRVQWDIEPNKKYHLIYKYETGEITLQGNESSKINITSSPSGARIFAGKPKYHLTDTGRTTPYSFGGSTVKGFAPEDYQVSLAGYQKSSVISRDNTFGDRNIHFDLEKGPEPTPPPAAISPLPSPEPLEKKPLPPLPVPPFLKLPLQEPEENFAVYTGTGWVTKSGYIITNQHVIDGQFETFVRFNSIGPEKYPATIVLSDKHNDLAVLKLFPPAKKAPGIPISSKMPRVGADVFTIGYPQSDVMGKNPKVTNGIVSSLSGIRDDPRVIQTTVAIQPGNSGGPLITMDGKVVGVTSSSLRPSVGEDGVSIPQSVNYAVKAPYIIALLASLPENNDYPMLQATNSKLEGMIPKLQDSIVQVIVKRRK